MKFVIETPQGLNIVLNKLNLWLGLRLLMQMWSGLVTKKD